MSPDGLSLIGGRPRAGQGRSFQARDSASGEPLPACYQAADAALVAEALELAKQAAPVLAASAGRQRARLLETMADRLAAREADFVALTPLETGLPEARVKGELARTCNQLRAFAALLEEGSWLEARIDPAQPDRQPLPRPDLRSLLRPLGPVAVFGASNFPLAFSVAGGDTASALAAGNPVLVKAHPAHPGTSLLAALALSQAVAECGFPAGAFACLLDDGIEVGRQLVLAPQVKAVAFTGSQAGGRALMDLAASRAEPIPVFAEMGSVNPLYFCPGKLAEAGAALAEQLAASITLGCGQFCTNPGLVVVPQGEAGDAFCIALAERLRAFEGAPMLTAGIGDNYLSRFGVLGRLPGVKVLVAAKGQGTQFGAGLLECGLDALLAEPRLQEETFGPCSLLVRAEPGRFAELAARLDGQLTAGVFHGQGDQALVAELLPHLEARAGRVIFNGFPTGVEVAPAMVHGGPWPACSDSRFTAVGTGAIRRFCRPVCYQDVPQALLPLELRDDNPLGLLRLVDGVPTREGP
ncbi:aldehyde dehydrogenase (NADP(+)) [Gallaecimonas sp. GXIMD4217]|uniref:aldehyde dehydrogenase (NADP(+)) n=1 Tax=Gallaecimonas sp. GXIMD4217 TaxID=3131927 RepID=UPI00311ACA96